MGRHFEAPRFEEVRVSSLADAMIVRRLAGDFARDAGFPSERQEDARLVASELAHNHVAHHTVDGRIRLSLIPVAGVPVLFIESVDNGPGIKDIKGALLGRRAMDSGLGAGLGTVQRLSDKMDICSSACPEAPCPVVESFCPYVTIVSAMICPESAFLKGLERLGLDFWAVSRSLSSREPCGDGFLLQYDHRYVRLVVTDGEGHGPEAMDVTMRAIDEIARWELLWPVDNIINALPDTMPEATRSLALCVMLLDTYTGKVQISCLGSIRLLFRLVSGSKGEGFENSGWIEVPRPQRGMLGQPGWQQVGRIEYGPLRHLMAVAYTDGHVPISREYMDELGFPRWSPAILGCCLFRPATDPKDDATLVVMKWNPE